MLMNGSNFQGEDFVELPGTGMVRHHKLNRVCHITVSIFEKMYKSASDPNLKTTNRGSSQSTSYS